MNKSISYSRQIRNFFGVKVHLFETKNCNTPRKLNPKIKMKLLIPKNLLSSAPMTSTEHLRRDDVETRPSASKIRLRMTDSPRIPLIVDFGRTRQLPDPDRFGPYYYINTAILLMLKYRCELFAARPSNERLPLALAPFYRGLTPGGGVSRHDPPRRSLGYKSRASPGIPFIQSIRALAATSLH